MPIMIFSPVSNFGDQSLKKLQLLTFQKTTYSVLNSVSSEGFQNVDSTRVVILE